MSSQFPASINIDQGRNWTLNVTWNNPDGSPVNLTGYSATFGLSVNYATSLALTLTSGAGITLGGSAGTIAISATGTQTNITPTNYTAELVLTSNSGVITSLLKGYITVTAKVVP
jgi:hypothetical protein